MKIGESNKKIALINPDYTEKYSGPVVQRVCSPTGLANCAAILRDNGWDVRIFDLSVNKDKKRFIEDSHVKESSIFILSTAPIDRWQCPPLDLTPFYNLAKNLESRFPGKKRIILGPHTVFMQEDLVDLGDIIIVGEPEKKIAALYPGGFSCFLKTPGIIFKDDHEIIKNPPDKNDYFNLSKLPLPAFDLLNYSQYAYTNLDKPTLLMETSRGCYYFCVFCFKKMYGDTVRFKPIENVIKELKYVNHDLGVKNIQFIDLNFIADKKRTIELCREIIKNNIKIRWHCDGRIDCIDEELLGYMKKAGCDMIIFGIESGTEKIHNNMMKNLKLKDLKPTLRLVRNEGIKTAGTVRFGHLGETEQDMLDTIRFVKSLPLDYVTFDEIIPYPTTAVYGKKRASDTDINKIVKKAYWEFYMRPGYLMGKLSLLKSPKSLFSMIQSFKRSVTK